MTVAILADENGSTVGGGHVGGKDWLKSEAVEVKVMAIARQAYFYRKLR